MQGHGSYIILAAVVVILCVVGSLTMYALANVFDDDAEYPSYSMESGIAEIDGETVPCTGTGSCTELKEPGTDTILRFDFLVVASDGSELSLRTHLFLGSDGIPVSGLYEYIGEGTAGDVVTGIWRSVDDPGFSFHIHDGSVVAVEIDSGGVMGTMAQATP